MRKRNVQILFRLTEEEAEYLCSLAERSGHSRQALLQSMVMGYRLCEKPDPEFYKIMRELSAIGNRSNQDVYKRQDLTSSQVVTKLRTDDKVAQGFGVGRMTVQRFIRLPELIPPILQMVDEGKIALTPAVELSYTDFCRRRQADKGYMLSLIHI